MNLKLPLLEKASNILILGLGREGVSTYKFLKKYYPDKSITISDMKSVNDLGEDFVSLIREDHGLKIVTGTDYLSAIDNNDLIIKSPGIPNKTPEIEKAKNKGKIFYSQTRIFLDLYRDKIIGITGTKGKSTTSSLLQHIFSFNAIKSELIGNIGLPVLDYIEKAENAKHLVFEMSSHQIADTTVSPKTGIFLNIFPEHLDYYKDYKDYFLAKVNIFKYQRPGDYSISNYDFPKILALTKKLKSNKYYFSAGSRIKNGCEIKNGDISLYEKGIEIYKFTSIEYPLKGEHNSNNIAAAIIASYLSGLDPKSIDAALKTFKPLEGRLETVATIDSVEYINDTLATIPQATSAAIDAFEGKEITCILGGFDRGIDFHILGSDISAKNNVTNVILIGTTAGKIEDSLKKYGYKGKIFNLGFATMPNIVKLASEITSAGGVVLLSPAATSFDMFKDYKDRGEQFRLAANNLNAK